MPIIIADTVLMIFVFTSFVFILSILMKRNDIADIAWGVGFILIAVFLIKEKRPSITDIEIVVYSLVVIWGLRLSLYLLSRTFRKQEDFRYRKWREAWGRWVYLRSFFQVYLLQGGLMMVISAPMFVVFSGEEGDLAPICYVGIMLWTTGFFFEVVGDWQKSQFKKTAKVGDVLQTGLWKYSRHPNYFGEILIWWGIFLVTLPVEGGVWGLISPVLITWLLIRVSGISMLEKKYEGNSVYDEYKRRTSSLIPWVPMKK